MILTNSGNKLSNLTFYDIKKMYTQAKNYALNISEIEAKVLADAITKFGIDADKANPLDC